jgi:glycosyltransferase involved in cell wall biosynthesis
MTARTGSRRYDLAVILRAEVFGGSERHTVQLLNYLSGTGLRVVLFQSGSDFRRIGAKEVPGVLDIVDTDLPTRDLSRRDAREWTRLVREHPADRILLVKPYYLNVDLPFARLVRKAAPRVFHFEHSMPPRLTRLPSRRHFGFLPGIGLWWHKERLRRWLMSRQVDTVFVDSETARRELLEVAFLREDQVVAHLNGLDVDEWARDERKGLAFRDRYGIPRDRYLFGTAGRIDQLKGVGLAIRSYARLVEGGRDDVYLCVAGEGPARAEYERLARELGLEGHAAFTGYVDDISAAYSAFDTLLFPSELESCPLVLLEAMGCGCRLIASPVGGIAELMGDPDCGDLMPTRDPGDWADVMRRHCGTPAGERPALAARIRDYVVKNHDQRRQFDFLAACFGAREATLAAC